MPKAQVLVTVTAEAVIDVPADVTDVEVYCQEHLGISWGDLHVDTIAQEPAFKVDHYLLVEPEPEPEPEPVVEVEPVPEAEPVDEPVAIEASSVSEEAPVDAAHAVAEPSSDDTLPLPSVVARFAEGESDQRDDILTDPDYSRVIAAAVRERAERLIGEVVNQVVTELEPLLRRHYSRSQGTQ